MGKPFVIQIVGYKNAGKTTLASALISRLISDGYQVGSIKHDAHAFEIDTPDTDTWKLRQSGASMVSISSDTQSALMMTYPLSLEQMLTPMNDLDVVVVEGFKMASYPKLILMRDEKDIDLLQLNTILAVVYDQTVPPSTYSSFQRNHIESIYTLIVYVMNKGDEARGA
jgi:molybdopterin-guanine dinucleotide biosynthesis protein B